MDKARINTERRHYLEFTSKQVHIQDTFSGVFFTERQKIIGEKSVSFTVWPTLKHTQSHITSVCLVFLTHTHTHTHTHTRTHTHTHTHTHRAHTTHTESHRESE